ncbi:DUF6303 family protein [Streptomyces coeruleorubidus]|jgi:hypothetical protein|uniref:DUF6303 family protein n=1 Tax=Streptomyces coeruleorubidus TaxID=116188 RepID=UPI0033B20DB0
MSDVVNAGLWQMPDGSWQLWVYQGSAGPLTAGLAATEPSVLPPPADRTAALASLGYRPADPSSYASGWGWEELDTGSGGLRLAGRTAVVALDRAALGRPSQPAVAHRGPLTAEDLGDLLGPDAAGWPALGLTVQRGGILRHMADQQVRVFHCGELIGFTEQSTTAPDQRIYKAVVYIDHEGLPYGSGFPPGVIPTDPIKAHEEAKARFES